ncbi:MAG: hypothetical protein CL661_04030 [Bacteroidetes bacterium]|nr:hypothetical protein [Bacteroidota bacterium]
MNKLRFLILLLLIHGSTFAGWVINEESTDLHGNKLIQTIYIQDNLIRYETPSSIAIIDLNNNFITIVFSQYKVFWTGTIDELKASSLETYKKQKEEILAVLPPSERNELDSIYLEIEKQMLDTTNHVQSNNYELVETNDKLEILGYNTTKYNILTDSIVIESIWHTTEIQPYNDVNLHRMMVFMKQLNSTSSSGIITQIDEYFNLLKSGILLKSVEFLPDGNRYEANVTNIREVNIVSDFFLPPRNYRKTALSDILDLMPEISEYGPDW